jgi:hypothetical protein
MGKRELLLIGVFLVLGMGVYQMTAPPAKPGQEGFSFGKLFSHIRAEIQGEDARAPVDRKAQQAVDAGITRLTLPDFRGMLTVTGEDRADVAAELTGLMSGIDETVAKTRAAATHLTLEPSDDEITVKISRPDETPRLRNAELRLRVPARLAVSLEFRGEAELRGVAEVKFHAARGRTNVRDVGAIRGDYANGELEILAVGEIELKTQRTQVRIDGVKKTLTLESEHGEVRIQRVAGAATLDLDRVECEADAIKGKTTIRVEHGNLTLRGISAATEVTGDGAGLDLMMASAVPLTATTSNDELMVELPKGGVTLDVLAQHGRVRVPDRGLKVEENEEEGERRLNANLRGGGPTLRLRNEHADIVIREGGMMDSDTETSERPDHSRHPTPSPSPAPEPVEPPKPPAPPPPPPRAPRP